MKPRRKFPPTIYRQILLRQEGICACGCKEKFTDLADVNYDHILPLHMDGKDEPENLQALKNKHHILKSSREAGIRAKIARIQKQSGLTKKKPSKKDKVMADVLGLET